MHRLVDSHRGAGVPGALGVVVFSWTHKRRDAELLNDSVVPGNPEAVRQGDAGSSQYPSRFNCADLLFCFRMVD